MQMQRRFISEVIVLLTCIHCVICCHREFSRIVRNLVSQKLYPAFEAAGADVPSDCPFNRDLELYRVQEEHKTMETLSKWTCEFCGKAFYAEYYLDQHFENRHSQFERKEKDSVCLADYCDIFRCDVVSGFRKADFWDVSLCLEDDMKEMKQKCEGILKKCIPKHLSHNITKSLTDQLTDGICSYLTCSKFWDSPMPQTDESKGVMYAVFTVMLVIILTIYYCVAYHYFCSDTFSDTYEPQGQSSQREHLDSHRRIRQRRRERAHLPASEVS